MIFSDISWYVLIFHYNPKNIMIFSDSSDILQYPIRLLKNIMIFSDTLWSFLKNIMIFSRYQAPVPNISWYLWIFSRHIMISGTGSQHITIYFQDIRHRFSTYHDIFLTCCCNAPYPNIQPMQAESVILWKIQWCMLWQMAGMPPGPQSWLNVYRLRYTKPLNRRQL